MYECFMYKQTKNACLCVYTYVYVCMYMGKTDLHFSWLLLLMDKDSIEDNRGTLATCPATVHPVTSTQGRHKFGFVDASNPRLFF